MSWPKPIRPLQILWCKPHKAAQLLPKVVLLRVRCIAGSGQGRVRGILIAFMTETGVTRRFSGLRSAQKGTIARLLQYAVVIGGLFAAASAFAQTLRPEEAEADPDIDLYALMSGTCTMLRIDGHDFACRMVAYFHTEKGRADFTVALDDPADASHVISFSGDKGRRTQENLYVLAIDRMLTKTKERPKVDGLPVPSVQTSSGLCKQVGNFAAGKVSSISCSATDGAGKSYQLRFESDGSPITIRRVRASEPTIKQDPYR
jgi:hypothetical protein